MTAHEIAAQLRDRSENIAGLLGELDAKLAAHSATLAEIPKAESYLAGLKDAIVETDAKLAALRADYTSVLTAYEALRAKLR